MSSETLVLRQPLPVDDTASRTERLLAQAGAGDERAFEELMQMHRSPVYRIALGILGNAEEAADVCQEVFIRFYRHLRRLRAERGVGAWLRRVTVHRCYDMLRQRKRDRELLRPPFPGEIGAQSVPDIHLLSRDVAKGLEALSPRERAAMILICHQGYSSVDAGKAMGCKAATVRVLVLRARDKLRQFLGGTTVGEEQ
jgi:RNA polymerase sigma-70 factor (ECF subfamily)